MAAFDFVWHTLVMRNLIRPVFRWFIRPTLDLADQTIESALGSDFHSKTADLLLDKSEQYRVELLAWSDQIDRKLLAVMTANGVYVAILVSIRDALISISVGALIAVGLSISYLAWRPHSYGLLSGALDHLIQNMYIHPDDLSRVLVSLHNHCNEHLERLNLWKSQKFSVSSMCLAVGALIVISYIASG